MSLVLKKKDETVFHTFENSQGDLSMSLEVDQAPISRVAELSFCQGKMGAGDKLSGSAEQAYMNSLSSHTKAIIEQWLRIIDCGDDRPIVGFADSTNDPAILRNRAVRQLFGGAGLALTKAMVIADAQVLKGLNGFQAAYEKVSELMRSAGWPDAGHAECGASINLEKTVANAPDTEIIFNTLSVLAPLNQDHRSLLEQNTQTARQLLEAGFFGKWSSSWHANFLTSKYPENFSYLRTANDGAGGHHPSGVYILRPGMVFEKNAFYEDTGHMSMAVTPDVIAELARFGGTTEEQARIAMALQADIPIVGATLLAPETSVYA